MTLEEKDRYIENELMKLSAETLRFMVADHAAEIEQLVKCRELIDALERMHLDTFNALVEKSDKADTDALKYIYANQAIGVDSALKTLQGSMQLLGIRRVV